ncbi:MAG: hypothetical protein ACE37F_13120 [Nannocystaceae bacterium]|nr:hypothetical protein [bacterium]
MPSETVFVPVHDVDGRLLGHAELALAHRLLELGMLVRSSDGDLCADEEHLELVEDELVELAATETTLVTAEPAATENMLPAGVELSRRAEFDSETGVGEFVVRVEGLDTDAYLALLRRFFASRRQGVLSAG